LSVTLNALAGTPSTAAIVPLIFAVGARRMMMSMPLRSSPTASFSSGVCRTSNTPGWNVGA